MRSIAIMKLFRGRLDTQTVTTGTYGTAPYRYRGFRSVTNPMGSISDGTCNFFGGIAIDDLSHNEDAGTLTFSVATPALGDSGWTTLTIDGTTTLYRVNATYSFNATSTFWFWSAVTYPFGADASTHTVVFT